MELDYIVEDQPKRNRVSRRCKERLKGGLSGRGSYVKNRK